MRRINSRNFFWVISNLGVITQMHDDENSVIHKEKNNTLSDGDKKFVRDLLKEIKDNSKAIGAPTTAVAAEDLLKLFRKKITYTELGEEIKLINEIFRKEIRTVALFSVSTDKVQLIDNFADRFGKDFENRFASSAYELQESSHCLALGRDTAAVFHLMRVMEAILRAVNACLGLPDPTGSNRNWGNMLSSIKAEMNSRNANNNSGWNGTDKELFLELYASLDAVRAAWRNTTMHIERRYDADEASHLFAVVKEFAKKVAGRMDETGSPLA